MRRVPRGYVGGKHETIGSDIISVYQVVTLPEPIFGERLFAQLKEVKTDGWYPISLLLETMDILAQKVGPSALRQMGRQLFRNSHAERAKQAFHSVSELLNAFDDIYHHANRGEQIGGWQVVSFEPGKCELLKNTPHQCVMEEGILIEACETLGVPVFVKQTECFRGGSDICRYVVSSVVTDQRWTGTSAAPKAQERAAR